MGWGRGHATPLAHLPAEIVLVAYLGGEGWGHDPLIPLSLLDTRLNVYSVQLVRSLKRTHAYFVYSVRFQVYSSERIILGSTPTDLTCSLTALWCIS